MKISKEIKTGIIAIAAIGLLVAGVNFLKGNSFFGGDDIYYVYFPNTAGVTPATSVVVNGVVIGKVLEVELTGSDDLNKQVMMTFNIQDPSFKIPKGSEVKAGGIDLLTKGIIVYPNHTPTQGYYKPGDKIQGIVSADILGEVKAYADPLVAKVQTALGSLDKFINQVSSFWDTTATTELKGSMKELQEAIKKLGSVASEVESLVAEEKIKLSRIFSNVESITGNLEKSNAQITAILGNAKQISDDLVSADFKGTIAEAKNTLTKFNQLLESANNGEGTLGKLLSDDQLYNELNKTNQRLQNLVEDFEVHPERYIHFSVFGAKTKGVPLSPSEERELKRMLDSNKVSK